LSGGKYYRREKCSGQDAGKHVIMMLSRMRMSIMEFEMKTVVNSRRADHLAALTEEALESKDREAESLARKLLEVVEVLHGPVHIEVAIALCYLAVAVEENGGSDEALDLRRRAGHIFLSLRRALN
jgi:hypothetical protein